MIPGRVANEPSALRVVVVEPQGQGGICHYTYSLCAALSATHGIDTTLATGYPYELADAPHSFEVVTAFGPGRERRVIQALTHRQSPWKKPPSDPRFQSGNRTAVAVSRMETAPYQASSIAGRASRWLSIREADRGWRGALEVIRRKQAAVAHIQWFTNPARDSQWLDKLHARHVPVVITAHNILPHDALPAIRESWARIYQAADAIIVHYQRALDELDELGIELSKVTVIPHGNYNAIQALNQGSGDESERRSAARRRLGLSLTAPVVLMFGLMRPYKGIQHLLPAFASVRQELPEARLILAGRAPDGFGSAQVEITRLGLDDATLAFPTYLPLRDVADLFEACDVVALPYVEASQSGVVQLAYAYSRPVVATRVGGIPDAVAEEETGVLVAPRDSEQLARALLALIRDRERCERLGQQARQFAENRFTWESIAQQTAQVYQRVRKSFRREI